MSYDLTKSKDLYSFSRDCEEACCFCPQYRPWNPIDFEESRNNISPFNVFLFWKEGVGGNTLFSSGYCANLSKEAQETFSRYSIKINFNDEGKETEPNVIDLFTGKSISKRPMRIL